MPFEFNLRPESRFSFECRVCSRCCTGKTIMAGPHEVLGMARLLGMHTTEFLSLYTDNGGTTLRSDEAGRCVFCTASGCRVHSERPLVCRLYPLGRMTDETGAESFALFPRQSDCDAEVGCEGTIKAYLDSQGVGPYLQWSRRYGELCRRMVALLERLGVRSKVDSPSSGSSEDAAPAEAEFCPPAPDRAPLSPWQDIDASLDEYCAARGVAVPRTVEDAITLHLQAIDDWLRNLESRAIGETDGSSSNHSHNPAQE